MFTHDRVNFWPRPLRIWFRSESCSWLYDVISVFCSIDEKVTCEISTIRMIVTMIVTIFVMHFAVLALSSSAMTRIVISGFGISALAEKTVSREDFWRSPSCSLSLMRGFPISDYPAYFMKLSWLKYVMTISLMLILQNCKFITSNSRNKYQHYSMDIGYNIGC